MPEPFSAAENRLINNYGLGQDLMQQQQNLTEEDKRKRRLGLSALAPGGSAAAAMLNPTLAGPGTLGGRGY